VTLRSLGEAGNTKKQPAVGGEACLPPPTVRAHRRSQQQRCIQQESHGHVLAHTSFLFTPAFHLLRVKKGLEAHPMRPLTNAKRTPRTTFFFHSCRLPSFVILGLYEICQSTATLKDNKELEKT
jgi:hypothetical protein